MLPFGASARALVRLRVVHRQITSARMVMMSCERKNEVLASPPLDTAPKEYPPKIQHLVKEIAGLTLLEIAELNDLLKVRTVLQCALRKTKQLGCPELSTLFCSAPCENRPCNEEKTLKIENMAMMQMGAAMPGPSAQPAAQQVEEEEEVAMQKAQSFFTVKLTEMSAEHKVKLIKEVKNWVPGINLVQAKKMVEMLPQDIKTNVSKDEAEKIKAALEAVGGKVVLE